MRSPIYSLPPEILTLILQVACPLPGFLKTYGVKSARLYRPPFSYSSGAATRKGAAIIKVLSAVSAHWNNVVSSTPSLWTSFIAGVGDLLLMQMIFQRSGHLPISASIDHPDSWTPNDSSIIVPLLQEHISRIRMLHVSTASPPGKAASSQLP
jgi:hypothetical protein